MFYDFGFDFEALDGRVSRVQLYLHSRCQLNVGRAQPARREQSCELELQAFAFQASFGQRWRSQEAFLPWPALQRGISADASAEIYVDASDLRVWSWPVEESFTISTAMPEDRSTSAFSAAPCTA